MYVTFIIEAEGIVNEEDAKKVDDSDDLYEPAEIFRLQEQLYKLLVITRDHDILNALHQLHRSITMYGLSSRLQIPQTFLQVDSQLMLGLFLRFQIFLLEKLRFGMLGQVFRLVHIKQIIEIYLGVLDRHIMIDQELWTVAQLFLVGISQLQVILAVEIYVHSVSIVII